MYPTVQFDPVRVLPSGTSSVAVLEMQPWRAKFNVARPSSGPTCCREIALVYHGAVEELAGRTQTSDNLNWAGRTLSESITNRHKD
eukprot:m.144907 g.144907  ORF g.144907 m.144907 type:complete len:86 (+) comp14110_c0_seq1:932-1189(+)